MPIRTDPVGRAWSGTPAQPPGRKVVARSPRRGAAVPSPVPREAAIAGQPSRIVPAPAAGRAAPESPVRRDRSSAAPHDAAPIRSGRGRAQSGPQRTESAVRMRYCRMGLPATSGRGTTTAPARTTAENRPRRMRLAAMEAACCRVAGPETPPAPAAAPAATMPPAGRKDRSRLTPRALRFKRCQECCYLFLRVGREIGH